MNISVQQDQVDNYINDLDGSLVWNEDNEVKTSLKISFNFLFFWGGFFES